MWRCRAGSWICGAFILVSVVKRSFRCCWFGVCTFGVCTCVTKLCFRVKVLGYYLIVLTYYTSFWYLRFGCCRSQWPRGLRRRSSVARLLRFGFESHRGHGRLSVVIVVYCQVEVSATSWSLVGRSHTDCGASLCVIKKPRKRGG